MKEYLNDTFKYVATENSIEFYNRAVAGKGEVTVEYNTEDNTANVLHTTINNRLDTYLVTDVKELKETVEYCLGPIVTDGQWNSVSNSEYIVDDGEDWDLAID